MVFIEIQCCAAATLNMQLTTEGYIYGLITGRRVPLSTPPAPVDGARNLDDSNLVDPASSHMLASRVKPCMCKFKQILVIL